MSNRMQRCLLKRSVLISTAAVLLVIIMLACSGCFDSTKPGIIAPSPVDTSILKPLADYPNYSLDELKARLDSLKKVEGVQYQSDGACNDDDGCVWYYGYYFDLDGVDVTFAIFGTPVSAKNALIADKNGGLYSDNASTLTTISQDVDIVRSSVYWYRSVDNLYQWSDFWWYAWLDRWRYCDFA